MVIVLQHNTAQHSVFFCCLLKKENNWIKMMPGMKTTHHLSENTFAKWTSEGSVQLNRKKRDRTGRLLSSIRKVYVKPITLPIILQKEKAVQSKLLEVQKGIQDEVNIGLHDNHVVHISKLYDNFYIGLHWLDEEDQILAGPGMNMTPQEWKNFIHMLKERYEAPRSNQEDEVDSIGKLKVKLKLGKKSQENVDGSTSKLMKLGKRLQENGDGSASKPKQMRIENDEQNHSAGQNIQPKKGKGRKGKSLLRKQYSLPASLFSDTPKTVELGVKGEIEQAFSTVNAENLSLETSPPTPPQRPTTLNLPERNGQQEIQQSPSPSLLEGEYQPNDEVFLPQFMVTRYAWKWHIPGKDGAPERLVQGRWCMDPEICELEGLQNRPEDPNYVMHVIQQSSLFQIGKELFDAAFAKLIHNEVVRMVETDKLTFLYEEGADDMEIYGKEALGRIEPEQILTLCQRTISFYQPITDSISDNLQAAFACYAISEDILNLMKAGTLSAVITELFDYIQMLYF